MRYLRLLIGSVACIFLLNHITPPTTAQEGTRPPWELAIYSPAPYSNVGNDLLISGIGWGLFENNVVVEITNQNGEQLALEPTTMLAPDLGRYGSWSIGLSVAANDGDRLTITAYSESPMDGSRVVEDKVTVVYGDTPSTRGVHIIAPQPYAQGDSSWVVSGTAYSELDTVYVLVLAVVDGNVLAETTVPLTAQGAGRLGTWVAEIDVAVPSGSVITFIASPTSDPSMASDEITLASDMVQVVAE